MQSIYEKVIGFIQANGPSLPIQIAKVMEKDSFYAGAILSDLIARKMVRISTARIGGSPVYYLPEQQEQLSKLYDHLPLREKEAYGMLKEQKMIKDKELQPVMRVALQQIKDFAIPFEHNAEKMWRWYLTSEEELKQLLNPPQQLIEVIQQPEIKIQQTQAPIHAQPIKEDTQQKLERKQKLPIHDTFSEIIDTYIKKNNLIPVELLSQRKNKEMISIVKINSSIGDIEMLLIAKNKKKITNSDLSLAHQKGQAKKLPTLFISTGEMTKKTEQHMEKNLKGLLFVKKI
ncbi:MAG: hypothetical protein AABX72_00295 [Nanoarchaeota archaeon]